MKTFTIEEFQKNFDDLLSRIEKGESLLIKSKCGSAIMIPYGNHNMQSDTNQCFWDHDDGC